MRRPWPNRRLSYFVDGKVRTISQGGSEAVYRYDAFGSVERLDIDSDTSPDTRRDHSYGDLLGWNGAASGGASAFLTRKIPGPDGLVATRRGANGPWVFEFGEARGGRFFVDETGEFVQNVDYSAYGDAASSGAQPGSDLYSNGQWNGGDSLAAFGLSHLGARLYDPALGRFLSRDPLLVLRTAATTNPYAFAMNDPVNSADPSGLDCEGFGCLEPPCFLCELPFPGNNGGGGGSGDWNGNHHGGGGGAPTGQAVNGTTARVSANVTAYSSDDNLWPQWRVPDPILIGGRDRIEKIMRYLPDDLPSSRLVWADGTDYQKERAIYGAAGVGAGVAIVVGGFAILSGAAERAMTYVATRWGLFTSGSSITILSNKVAGEIINWPKGQAAASETIAMARNLTAEGLPL